MESAAEVVCEIPIAITDELVSLTSLLCANHVCFLISASCSTSYLCSKEILEYQGSDTIKRSLAWTCPRGGRQTSHGTISMF